jgi:hypothetical protein
MSELRELFAAHGIDFGYAVHSLTEPRSSIIKADAKVVAMEGALKLHVETTKS